MTADTGAVPDTRRAPDWRDSAACRDAADLMFETSPAGVELAKSVCAGCPVQAVCLAWALDSGQEWGVWGGKSEAERRAMLRRRVADGETVPPRKGGRPRAECGTASAYDRHSKLGEPIDDACRAAHTARSAEYRQAREKREPAKCGTRSGYQKHVREKTPICQPCRQANTDADNRLRRTGTTKVLVPR